MMPNDTTAAAVSAASTLSPIGTTDELLDCDATSVDCRCHTTYLFYDPTESLILGRICFFVILFGAITNLIS